MRTRTRLSLAASVCCLLLQAPAADGDARTKPSEKAFSSRAPSAVFQTGRRRRRPTTRAKAKPQSTTGGAASTQTSGGAPTQTTNAQKATNAPTANPSTTNAQKASNTSGGADVSLEQPFVSTLREPKPGEEQKRGLLTRVDCAPGNVVFHVRVGEQTLRLRNKDLGSVQIVTYTPDVSGEFTCDERKPPNHVLATFRPGKDARTKTDGLLVALDFIPKDWQ